MNFVPGKTYNVSKNGISAPLTLVRIYFDVYDQELVLGFEHADGKAKNISSSRVKFFTFSEV